jgi:hypothetical protein
MVEEFTTLPHLSEFDGVVPTADLDMDVDFNAFAVSVSLLFCVNASTFTRAHDTLLRPLLSHVLTHLSLPLPFRTRRRKSRATAHNSPSLPHPKPGPLEAPLPSWTLVIWVCSRQASSFSSLRALPHHTKPPRNRNGATPPPPPLSTTTLRPPLPPSPPPSLPPHTSSNQRKGLWASFPYSPSALPLSKAVPTLF